MDERDLSIHFAGPAAEAHHVDVDDVVPVLQGLQRSLRMMASAHDGWQGDGQRYRGSNAVKKRVVLQVGPLEAGSLVVPMRLPGHDTKPLLIGLVEAIRWFASGGDHQIDLVPGVLRHIGQDLLKWLPKRRTLRLALDIPGFESLQLNDQVRETVEQVLERSDTPYLTIKGTVTRIYNERREVALKYIPSGRNLRLRVPAPLMGELSGDRDQVLEVTGTFRTNLSGQVADVVSIDRVDFPDLDPFVVSSFRLGQRVLVLKPPLELNVYLDEEFQQLYVVEDPDVGLHAFAETRQELSREVEEQLGFLWRSFAQEQDARMSLDARQLAANLRRRIAEER